MRPKPLTPIPVAICRADPLEEAFRDDPENEDVENAAAEPMVAVRAAKESFMMALI